MGDTRYTIVEGEVERACTLGGTDESLCLTVDGAPREVSVSYLGDGRLHMLVDGRSVDVVYRLEGSEVTCWLGGREFRFAVYTDRELSRLHEEQASAGGHRPEVDSPMAGKIIAIAVGVDDPVEAGDPLLVIEAMKMENVIRATHPGVVEAVDVALGDIVERGARLARVRAIADGESGEGADG